MVDFVGSDPGVTVAAGQLSKTGTTGVVGAWTASSITGPGVGMRFQCGTMTTTSNTNAVAVPGSGQSVGNGWKHIGLKSGASTSRAPTESESYNTILYGVSCQGGHNIFSPSDGNTYANSAWVNTAGMSPPSSGASWNHVGIIPGASPYTSSMVFEIRLTSTGVEWYLDGSLAHSIQTTISYPLYVEAYLYTPQDPSFFNMEWVEV